MSGNGNMIPESYQVARSEYAQQLVHRFSPLSSSRSEQSGRVQALPFFAARSKASGLSEPLSCCVGHQEPSGLF